MHRRNLFRVAFAGLLAPIFPKSWWPVPKKAVSFVRPDFDLINYDNDLSYPLTYDKVRRFTMSGCVVTVERMVEIIDTARDLEVWEAAMLVAKYGSKPSRDPSESGYEIYQACDRFVRHFGWPRFEEFLKRCNVMPEIAWRLVIHEYEWLRRHFVYEDRFWGDFAVVPETSVRQGNNG